MGATTECTPTVQASISMATVRATCELLGGQGSLSHGFQPPGAPQKGRHGEHRTGPCPQRGCCEQHRVQERHGPSPCQHPQSCSRQENVSHLSYHSSPGEQGVPPGVRGEGAGVTAWTSSETSTENKGRITIFLEELPGSKLKRLWWGPGRPQGPEGHTSFYFP